MFARGEFATEERMGTVGLVLFVAYTAVLVAGTLAAATVVVVAGTPWRIFKCLRGRV